MSDQTLKNSRMTKQRAVILRELQKVTSHPTAEEIFVMVKHYIPNISLGTVYRNLDFLVEAGTIRKLETAGSVRRFDGNISPHSHARCTSCGKVVDVFCKVPSQTLPDLSFLKDFVITQAHIEYEGLCATCQ